MGFLIRTEKPKAGNKYYIRKANGGYSNAIKGYPTDKDCDVLSNCVGYSYGRFNEIGGYGYCKYLAPVNAERFMLYKGSCKSGNEPKPGACMVWQKGNTLSCNDGAGHVAIVEKVISKTEVYTSESGYGGKAFWNQTRKKGADGRWGCGSGYKFLGFIYNPAVNEETIKNNVNIKNNETNKNNAVKNTSNTSALKIKKGDIVKIAANATYYNGQAIPGWVKSKNWIVKSISNDRVVIDKAADGTNSINSPVNLKFLIVVNNTKTAGFKPYNVKVTASCLNKRKGAGTNFAKIGSITNYGTFTIVSESKGTGAALWGKLKDKDGWIALDFTKNIG